MRPDKLLFVVVVLFLLATELSQGKESSSESTDSFDDRLFLECAYKHYDRFESEVHSKFLTDDLAKQIANLRATFVALSMLKIQSQNMSSARPTKYAVRVASWAADQIIRKSKEESSLVKELIPLLHLAGELNLTAGDNAKAVYYYETEAQFSRQIQEPVQPSCHASLSELYLKMGKLEKAKKEAFLAKQSVSENGIEITIPAPGELIPRAGTRKN